jgi:hypothetical protein
MGQSYDPPTSANIENITTATDVWQDADPRFAGNRESLEQIYGLAGLVQ